MRRTEQLLPTAIAELRCIGEGRPATLDDSRALQLASDCVSELLRDCVDQMRRSRTPTKPGRRLPRSSAPCP